MRIRSCIALIVVIAAFAFTASAQTTEFVYQGQLQNASAPANGGFDFEFLLFDAGGSQQGSTLTRSGVAVANGIFSVKLDFGGQFTGALRLLEIHVRPAGGSTFTTLTPRQLVSNTPYAVKTLNADTAAQAAQLGGIPPSGFIQNTTSQQAGSEFNISGNGTAAGTLKADTVVAQTQFNIGGNRVLSTPGTDNLFAGINAGLSNTTGSENAFFGRGAGFANLSGFANSFYGYQAGNSFTTGSNDSFFGSGAGQSVGANLLDDSFFGHFSGQNATGNFNSFFGTATGGSDTGDGNSFFGESAGYSNTSGAHNTFVGELAGNVNTTGFQNTFVGRNGGDTNTAGSNNTTLGFATDVGSNNLSFATAIGSGAVVSTSNTIVLGRSDGSDTVDVPGKLQIDTLGTAGSINLCLNSSNRVGTCSSSLRYKTNIGVFGPGLSLIQRLRPITFDWKEGGMKDVGFGAEDVAKIDRRFVTYNAKGEVEGVKYDRLSAAFVNAFKEQQAQIEAQQKQIEQLKSRVADMDALKKLVCLTNKQSEICKEQ